MFRILLTLCVLGAVSAFVPKFSWDKNRDWMKEGQDLLKKNLNFKPNLNVAKNVIVFIGDGMGLMSVTSSRIYKGQRKNKAGEDELLAFDTFPHAGISKTYCSNHQIPDSGATATAILSGQKVNFGVLGLNDNVERAECDKEADNKIETIMDWSKQAGKSTGFISTARATHATPAATYAKTAERRWEVDTKIPDEYKGKCKDIAYQLVYDNYDINLMFAGGRRYFLPNTTADEEYPDKKGNRGDGINLIEEWKNKRKNINSKNYEYVWNKKQFDDIDEENTEFVLGLFDYNHMKYVLDRKPTDEYQEPTLPEMTEKAINMLKKNNKGYFLLVEGARIDHAHHDGKAKKALEETLEMDDAVQKALELTSQEDTLILVTADHDHTFSMTGYNGRGSNILGFHDEKSMWVEPSRDGNPVLILGYADGPGPANRQNLTGVDPTTDDYLQRGKVDMQWSTHGGADVGIYAVGPMAHLIDGVVEQNYIGHVLSYASCVGPNKGHCEGQTPGTKPTEPAPCTGSITSISVILMASSLLVYYLQYEA